MIDDMVAFDDVRTESAPYTWYHLPRTFEPATAAALGSTFPSTDFTKVTREADEKSYTMWYRRLQASDGSAGEPCPEVWQRFVDHVTGPTYRQRLARLTGLPVEDAPVEVNVWRYDRDCWLDPHVDKQDKLVTHVFYFNDDWPSDGGGNLLLLRSASPQSVVRRVPPVANSSVLLVRTDDSWHAVERVHDGQAPRERRSAQVIFYRS